MVIPRLSDKDSRRTSTSALAALANSRTETQFVNHNHGNKQRDPRHNTNSVPQASLPHPGKNVSSTRIAAAAFLGARGVRS